MTYLFDDGPSTNRLRPCNYELKLGVWQTKYNKRWMKMLFHFDRYPLVKLHFLFFHLCLVTTDWGRARCWRGEIGQRCAGIENINQTAIIFVVSNIAETVPLLLSFYAPLTETWLCMMERGDRGGNIREFTQTTQTEKLTLISPLCTVWSVSWSFSWDLSNDYSDELWGPNWH